MDRNTQRIGLVNIIALLFLGSVAVIVSRLANSSSGQMGAIWLGMGFLVSLVSYFQMWLDARERMEQLEFEELKKSAVSSAIFSEAAETFPARRSREQFEKYFVPGFTLFLLIVQALACSWTWKWLVNATPLAADKTTMSMALWASVSLVLFLLGKYAAGVARLGKDRLLQPGASYILLGAFLGFLITVAHAGAWFGLANADKILAKFFCILLGLVAVENLISLILEIYRPRLKGQAARILYESRVIGLLGQPGGLITTAAQALDYQFGFKVSETWFYQFLEKSIAWLILLQLSLLFISTCVVMIQPQEQAILERFGHPVKGREILDSGIHFKWPWPIDKTFVYSSKNIHTFFVGYTPDETATEKALTWTRKHHKEEFSMIVANRDQETFSSTVTNTPSERVVPVNLLAINIPVQYRIVDLKKWAVLHAKAPEILENIANREVVRYLINVDIDELMTTGRLAAADFLQKEINAQASRHELGIEIVQLGFQSVHPPVQVAADYEKVIGAIQEKETNLLGAQAYWAERIPQAAAESTNLISVAKQQSLTKVAMAEAQSVQFSNQLTAFLSSPSVYKRRAYLETLVQDSAKARKYVITATNTEDVLLLNLEDKLRDDLENLQIPPAR